MSLQPEMEVNEPNLSLKNLIPKICCFWFPLNKTIRKVVCFLSGKWEGKISVQISLRICGCCKIWWTRRVFLWPTFPFASIEASALRNKPSRETGVKWGLRLRNVEVKTWRMYSYTIENSCFEHNNGVWFRWFSFANGWFLGSSR